MNREENSTSKNEKFSTGIFGLDNILKGIVPGDTLVWQVEDLQNIKPFVYNYARNANKEKKSFVYFRFAEHFSFIPNDSAGTIIYINPSEGFEHCLSNIIREMSGKGKGIYYIFDHLTNLAVEWFSDVMIANFFVLIAPFLKKNDSIGYFIIKRDSNASHSIKEIHNAASIVINVHKNDDGVFIHPLKVLNRHSSTIYMLHQWIDPTDPTGDFIPVNQSGIVAKTLSNTPISELDFTIRRMDSWFLLFKQADDVLKSIKKGQKPEINPELLKNKIMRRMFVQDDRMRVLAVQFITLEDLLIIGRRMIGTGLVGGKTVGLILARAILRKNEPEIARKLEKHDSFYIGSHLFYSYLVTNDIWWDRKRLSNPNTFLQGIDEARAKIINGTFPRYILRQFSEMLHYFGQSPIVVRSSSLQEDAFGNSFSGKYMTIFCPNQGPPEERLRNFVKAVKEIYASTINRDALQYRRSRGLLDKDEEMALLIMRVSGVKYEDIFFPHLAGVGFSYNPFVWNKKIDPKSGFLRMVFGLGTRAVDRTDDDYTRLIALNIPDLRTSSNVEQIRKYSQNKFDYIDLKQNQFSNNHIYKVAPKIEELPLELFTTTDRGLEQRMENAGRKDVFTGILTFDPVISNTNFISTMKRLMECLQEVYVNPVDIEYTANFMNPSDFRINLLQCRPFQVHKEIHKIKMPENIQAKKLIFETNGPIIGTSRAILIDRVIYVVPNIYGKLTTREKYSIARLIGKLNELSNSKGHKILLLGPGRWGTTTPSLGIPVNYSEISNVTVMGEIAEMHDGLVPDISLGTHFFNNIVEDNIIYFAMNPDKGDFKLNRTFFHTVPNILKQLFPDYENWSYALKVIDADKMETGQKIHLTLDSLTQKGVCYLKGKVKE
ncbi:hypothetical protein NEF87_004434 [Candidatus Lokiarchaeum ossiferum]|uniref:Pyruvate phosphate dikinase AMP/ATP-binding domain-containing protein n=1 Tax=Candidatus Lokiarchaeum ossiferum TaxID=2951803 RepID=A0ABY6I0B9_9ARCH|nr:hypothetical protein NEF87_004434 [Candidatus Lokiarchaeum sp. B-35]